MYVRFPSDSTIGDLNEYGPFRNYVFPCYFTLISALEALQCLKFDMNPKLFLFFINYICHSRSYWISEWIYYKHRL